VHRSPLFLLSPFFSSRSHRPRSLRAALHHLPTCLHRRATQHLIKFHHSSPAAQPHVQRRFCGAKRTARQPVIGIKLRKCQNTMLYTLSFARITFRYCRRGGYKPAPIPYARLCEPFLLFPLSISIEGFGRCEPAPCRVSYKWIAKAFGSGVVRLLRVRIPTPLYAPLCL
jgi:hypothetical protein